MSLPKVTASISPVSPLNNVSYEKVQTAATTEFNLNESWDKYVKLNVGGSLHMTTLSTLKKQDNMLRAMFSGRMVIMTDKEGYVLIDRCGKHFSSILNYLRDGSIVIPEGKCELAELLAEAKYYLLQELVSQCEIALKRKVDDIDPICRVPIVTSPNEENELLSKTAIPIVKFLYNRSNNKYSYTNTSDDNMLKNIELFDKLSLRFNRRILFIKDIVGDEICVWSYHGNHRKIAEICCTSIVYATERKQTKVEFPEARIYEETLNILLYEPNKCSLPCSELQDFSVTSQSDDDLDEAHRQQHNRVRRIHVREDRPR